MAKTKTKTRRIYVSRKRRGGGRGKFTIPLAVLAGFGPMVSDVVHGYQTGGITSASNDLLANVTGYDARAKKWDFALLAKGMGPVVAGILVHKLAGKLGVNRMLSSAGVPWVRI